MNEQLRSGVPGEASESPHMVRIQAGRMGEAIRRWVMRALVFGAAVGGMSPAFPADVQVATDEEFRAALAVAKAGTRILIAPGRYRGGFARSGLQGTEAEPVVIAGADPQEPPEFVGEAAGGSGSVAMHLSQISHVVLQDLVVRGFPGNGLNIDDGGSAETPSHHVRIEHLQVLRIGPEGNRDGLKMSGVDQFVVVDCVFHGWGGSAIDCVGCHEGVVERCRFEGVEGFSQSNAVQLKGGSRGVRVLENFFLNAGQRAINIGGSTGAAYFRPAVGDSEAAEIEVAGNRFVGGMAAVAWVTADGGHVHHNTFVDQEKWLLRILQENQDPRMRPSHDGLFEDNLVVVGDGASVLLNIGPATAPETFRFRRNAWYSRRGRPPQLPTPETDPVSGQGQPLTMPRTADSRPIAADGPLWDRGAHAYQPPQPTPPAATQGGGVF
jgi:hypothetical protein